jgi:prophage tail gpP-like protein
MTGIAELKVDGAFYGGWKTVRVSRSIEQMAGSFELEVTERWPGQPQRTPIRPGQKCQLLLDGSPVITGWVDGVSPEYDAGQHTLHVSGRDATCDLVDCSAIYKTGQWHKVKLDQLARDLCAPFGVGVVVNADVGAAFESYNIQEGESVFECLERAARLRALLLTRDPLGRLVIPRAGAAVCDTALIEGRNVKAARADFTWTDRFSEYVVKGYDRLEDEGEIEDAAPAATARDEAITRHRPLIVVAEAHGENSSFADRAEWEKTIRRGRSCRGSITVQGWAAGGVPWQPNTRVKVTSPFLWLEDAEMLIVGCTYSLDDQAGTLTELAIARPDAFELLEGMSQSKLFGKLKTREQRQKREKVEDWSWM